MLIHGNALHLPLRDESVQCVMTSPPYFGLRAYLPDGHRDKHHELGLEPSLDEYVAKMVTVFREVRRVLRRDGVAFLNLGDSYFGGGRGGGGSYGPERRGWRAIPCGISDKVPANSLAHGCLCGNLCDVCLPAYRFHKSRNDGLLAAMLAASLSASNRAHKVSLPGHLPTLHSVDQADHNEGAIQAQPPLQNHEAERLRAALASMFCESSLQLLDVCLQRANYGECLLCARSLTGCAQGCDGKSGDLQGQWQHNQDIAARDGLQVRHNLCIDTVCGCCAEVGSYPYYTTPHHDVQLKPKDLMGIPWRVAFALQADGWWLRSDIVWHKCLSGGTRVYAKTQKGEMPTTIKDLVRLDPATVKLWNGKRWTQAVSWSETKRNGDEVELVLRSGERIGCTGNHVWPTTRGNVRADALAVGDVFQICRLPEPDRPRRPGSIPDDIGWFIGLYIAEGSKSDGTIQIASHAEQTDRFHRLKTLAEMFDGYCFVANTGGKAATANINSPILAGILDAYVSGRTAKDKHLDVRCWKRSDDFLRAVLDGYLSGDGHHAGDRWRLGFCANDNLACDLRTICARLGLSLRLKRTFHTCTNAKGGPRRFPGWRGEIRDTHRESGGEIVAIEKSRARKFWDIAVEDDPHLFALASGVMTHNSNPMPESVTDRPTRSHEYLFLLTKSAKYYYNAVAIRTPAKSETTKMPDGWDTGAGTHGTFHRNGREKGQRTDKQRGPSRRHAGFNDRWDEMEKTDQQANGANARSVWTIATESYSGAHFATFPQALVTPCILAGSRSGDVVLDPFVGSGTVGVVCRKTQRRFVGIDLNVDYLRQAQVRVENKEVEVKTEGLPLFADRKAVTHE